jgi:hypothetical protein
MAGLVPAIHALRMFGTEDVDARHKAGHDEREIFDEDDNGTASLRLLHGRTP